MNNGISAEEIFKQYNDRVRHYIMGKVSDYYTAEDLTSSVFLKVYQKLDCYDASKASISTWVFTIANNTVIDYYRTHKVNEEVDESFTAPGEIDEDMIAEEDLNELAAALRSLPERDRDLIIMHYYDNLTLKEIAVKMGMSYANVKLVHNKALLKLKKSMDVD